MKIERCGDYWLAVEQGPLRKIVVEGNAPMEAAFAIAELRKAQIDSIKENPPRTLTVSQLQQYHDHLSRHHHHLHCMDPRGAHSQGVEFYVMGGVR